MTQWSGQDGEKGRWDDKMHIAAEDLIGRSIELFQELPNTVR